MKPTRIMYDRKIGAVTIGDVDAKRHYGTAREAVIHPSRRTWTRIDSRFAILCDDKPFDIRIRDDTLIIR